MFIALLHQDSVNGHVPSVLEGRLVRHEQLVKHVVIYPLLKAHWYYRRKTFQFFLLVLSVLCYLDVSDYFLLELRFDVHPQHEVTDAVYF